MPFFSSKTILANTIRTTPAHSGFIEIIKLLTSSTEI